MADATTASTYSNADEVFLIAHDDYLYPGVIEQIDLSTLAPDTDIPHIDSVKHAGEILTSLLTGPVRTISCRYKLDGLQFAEMRSSILRAGIVALAVQAGHRAIIAPNSTQLPIAHWRSEFIFRAIRGIRLIKPELSEQELLNIVTREIHFYTQHDNASLASSRNETAQHRRSTASAR